MYSADDLRLRPWSISTVFLLQHTWTGYNQYIRTYTQTTCTYVHTHLTTVKYMTMLWYIPNHFQCSAYYYTTQYRFVQYRTQYKTVHYRIHNVIPYHTIEGIYDCIHTAVEPRFSTIFYSSFSQHTSERWSICGTIQHTQNLSGTLPAVPASTRLSPAFPTPTWRGYPGSSIETISNIFSRE